jgi:hypothetical protein
MKLAPVQHLRDLSNYLGGWIGAVAVAALSLLLLSNASDTESLDALCKLERDETELDRLIGIHRKRFEMQIVILNNLVDDRISIDDAAVDFQDLCLAEPSIMSSICFRAETADENEACRRILLSNLHLHLAKQPELRDQVFGRLARESDWEREQRQQFMGKENRVSPLMKNPARQDLPKKSKGTDEIAFRAGPTP